jgi:hypothetical protein
MVTAINPDGIPGGHIDPDTIEASAARIATAGANVRNHGATVVTTWQRLSGVYEAPEDQQLFDVITPVGSTTTTVGDDLETVGNALKSFASEVRPIVARLMELKYQAELFVNTTVAHGVTVSAPMNAYQPSSFGAAPAAAPPSQQPWDENQGAIDRNNQLWNQVAAQQELLWAAERTCANKIRALYGAAALHSAASEKDPLGYGLSKIPDGTKMPWGAPAERTEGCAESSAKFVFKDVLWDGIVVGGLWGTIKGLGTLVLGYNPQTGDFFSGDAYGAAWSGVGMLAVGLATAGPASAVLGMTPGPVGDLVRGGQNALLNAGKGLIAWDKWQDDPGAALGESIFNIGTILIPAGAAVTGVKTAGMAARVLTATARVMGGQRQPCRDQGRRPVRCRSLQVPSRYRRHRAWPRQFSPRDPHPRRVDRHPRLASRPHRCRNPHTRGTSNRRSHSRYATGGGSTRARTRTAGCNPPHPRSARTGCA